MSTDFDYDNNSASVGFWGSSTNYIPLVIKIMHNSPLPSFHYNWALEEKEKILWHTFAIAVNPLPMIQHKREYMPAYLEHNNAKLV